MNKKSLTSFFKTTFAGLFGVVFVTAIFVALNKNAMKKKEEPKDTFTQFQILNQVKKKQKIVKSKPKPKPKKTDLKPNMKSLLKGMSFGLPAFEMDWAGEGGLLGNGSDYMDGSKVDKKPKVVYRGELGFPEAAVEKGVSGYVVFGLFIDSSGKLKKVELLESEPEGIFDDAATENIHTWKFAAAEHKGIKVATWQKQKIVFSMEN